MAMEYVRQTYEEGTSHTYLIHVRKTTVACAQLPSFAYISHRYIPYHDFAIER